MLSLTNISNKLIQLTEKYAEVLPQFHLAELNYTNTKAKVLMSQEVMGLASQPLREAEAERIMSLTKEYEVYQSLLPEKQILDMQLRVYQQLSKNLIAVGWGESNT